MTCAIDAIANDNLLCLRTLVFENQEGQISEKVFCLHSKRRLNPEGYFSLAHLSSSQENEIASLISN